jgi:hypothetical protein
LSFAGDILPALKSVASSDHGGSNAPTGSGYTKIYSNANAFVALKADGSITGLTPRYD